MYFFIVFHFDQSTKNRTGFLVNLLLFAEYAYKKVGPVKPVCGNGSSPITTFKPHIYSYTIQVRSTIGSFLRILTVTI